METITAALGTLKLPSRLEMLPGELRNHIWRFSILREHKVPALSKIGSSPSKVAVPPLAHVSSSIRKEVLSIYYGENGFEYLSSLFTEIHDKKDDWKEIQLWLEEIGGTYVHMLKSLTWRCEACHESPTTQKFHGGGGTLVIADLHMGLEHVRTTARFSKGICTGFNQENPSYCRCKLRRDATVPRPPLEFGYPFALRGMDIVAALRELQATVATETCWKLTWCSPCWQQYGKHQPEEQKVAARSETPARRASVG